MRAPKFFYQWNEKQGEVRLAYCREGKWVTGWGSKALYDDMQAMDMECRRGVIGYFDELWEERNVQEGT